MIFRQVSKLTAGTLLALVLFWLQAAGAQATRDSRYWPFSASSPWNTAIGSDAIYAPIQNGGGNTRWSSMSGGFNPTQWTVSVAVASWSDPEVQLYNNVATGATSQWNYLSGGGSTCKISGSAEANLLQGSSQNVVFDFNPYSTTCSGACNSQTAVPPASYHYAYDDYGSAFYMPAGFCATQDTDALVSVIQPWGWSMDAYQGVTTTDGKLIAGDIASYYDTQGDGTGWWNGRRASMIPSIAGLIRKGEIVNGVIPHALAVTMSSYFLTEQAVWPAYAFDTNAGYEGAQMPMGSLLAIPASVNISKLGLSACGAIVATAAQNYGVYVVDRGGPGGVTIQVEAGNTDCAFSSSDATTIVHALEIVTNNSQQNPGGGGTPRAPQPPPFSNPE